MIPAARDRPAPQVSEPRGSAVPKPGAVR